MDRPHHRADRVQRLDPSAERIRRAAATRAHIDPLTSKYASDFQGSGREPGRDRYPGVPAVYELGMGTWRCIRRGPQLAHRAKADESYQIGAAGIRRAYLNVGEIVATAQACVPTRSTPATASIGEPGIGGDLHIGRDHLCGPFGACARADREQIAGSRRGAGGRAVRAGILGALVVDRGIAAAASSMQFPVFVKAVAGGGGRGMRRVSDPAELAEAIQAASREAESAFGDPTVFLEQAVINPRHIEVQILADTHGNVIHLVRARTAAYSAGTRRSSSRASAKPRSAMRERICADAVGFARRIGYTCAGTSIPAR